MSKVYNCSYRKDKASRFYRFLVYIPSNFPCVILTFAKVYLSIVHRGGFFLYVTGRQFRLLKNTCPSHVCIESY